MCILCDHGTLRLLTAPLEQLVPGELGDAIRVAREAAGPGILDHAEAVLRGEAPPIPDAEMYGEVVVARALDAGVLSRAAASAWEARLRKASTARDPRVQAFVSTCAELVDEYRVLFAERREVVERYVEARGDAVEFAGIGQDGELWFEYREESYAPLTQAEATDTVERELVATLHATQPETLLRYSMLPDAALEVLVGVQAKPAEDANEILAGMIDLAALAEDRIRAEGYAPFFRGEGIDSVEDLRFGEWIIVRVPVLE